MDKNILETKLNSCLETFRQESNSLFPETSEELATKQDLNQLAKQVFYALEDIKNILLETTKG